MSERNVLEDMERLHRVVNGVLRPLAPTIAVIGFSGDVAVVIHAPGERTGATARAIGWDGTSEVFRLSPGGRRALVTATAATDPGMATWLGRKFEPSAPVARIYVITGDDALPVNFSAFGGWSLEPTAAASQLPS